MNFAQGRRAGFGDDFTNGRTDGDFTQRQFGGEDGSVSLAEKSERFHAVDGIAETTDSMRFVK